MPEKQRISLKLTDEQKQAVKAVTGKNADAIELSAEELEERIAPSKIFHKQELF